MKRLFLLLVISFSIRSVSAQDKIDVFYTAESKILEIALEKLNKVVSIDGKLVPKKFKSSNNRVVLLDQDIDSKLIKQEGLKTEKLQSEGFQILKRNNDVFIIGGDAKGLNYGILDLRDQLELGKSLEEIEEKVENPRFPFRAIKFNLPWSPYRTSEALALHMETVKDTVFWESFLDMMVDNRFNALTLWNLHPYTFMIQPEKYPEATQFTGQEFKQWQLFWRTLFRMAKDRGVETYILNWNIITSPQMTEAHDVANYKDDLEWHYGYTPADTSSIIVDYMRECITQTINEYPDLTGVGVSVGERMKMPIKDAMEWVKNTFVAGIKNANRPVKFIHRAPFSIDPEVAREYIESYTDIANPIIMEFKFNWSHGHSTPNLSITHGGAIADQYWNPKPKNYKMAWMMRNEDFIMLNWGNSNFIKEHIKVNGDPEIALGYFVGSETYIPAREFRMKPEADHQWKYAFEKQWEFYNMWGRLLYDPKTSDNYFIEKFNEKYGKNVGAPMFEALNLGSEMPLELASFYKSTWDFTLYCEGFLNGKQLYRNYKEATKAFIQIDEMITHETLDPRYLNIKEFNDRKYEGLEIRDTEITPLALADRMQNNGEQVLRLCAEMEGNASKNKANFQIELNDIKVWSYLSLYFAEKLRAGVLLDAAVRENNGQLQGQSIQHLKQGAKYWEELAAITSKQYNDVTLLHIRNFKFTWELYYSQVLKDIEIAQDALK